MINKSKNISAILVLACVTELLLALYTFVFHYLCMDHAEHLHAAWLVWQGEVPYRDFFEHHNPLLWYILAPLTAAFYGSAFILYIGRVVSALAYALYFIGFYKVCRCFLAVSGKTFTLALAFYFFVPDNMFLLFELQPDSFMLAALTWGVYFLFCYLEKRRKRDLDISFVFFALSFLFLQKAVLILAFIGIYICYLTYRKEFSMADALKAALWPAGCVAALYLYLFYTNSLNLYLLFNYNLNFWIQHFYGEGRVLDEWMVTVVLPTAAVLTLRAFLADGNKYRNILAGLAFANYGSLFLTGAPYSQYFIFVNLVAALIAAEYVFEHISYKRAQVLAAILTVFGGYAWCQKLPNNSYIPYYQAHKYIMERTTKDDPIMNTVFYFYNIYGRNPSYYWFGYGNIAPVAHLLYGYDEAFDPNKIIYEQRPKIVSKTGYLNMNLLKGKSDIETYQKLLDKIWQRLPHTIGKNKNAFIKEWSDIYYYRIDNNLIDAYYTETPYYPLFIRKDSPEKQGNVL